MTDLSQRVPDFNHYLVQHLPKTVSTADKVLKIVWDDGQVSLFPYLWLRELSPDDATYNASSREPMLTIVDLPPDLEISNVQICDDGSVSVLWRPENLQSIYHPGWLRSHCPQNPTPNYRLPARQLWTEKQEELPLVIDARRIDADDIFTKWLTAIHTEGFGLIKGLDLDPDIIRAVVSRIGTIRTTNYGTVFDVQNIQNAESNAYTSQMLLPHTDLCTHEYQPGLQFLLCLENNATGGDSIFVDGYKVARQLKETHPEQYDFLTKHAIPFESKGTDTEYRYQAPVLELDHKGDLSTIRFTYWLRSPMTGDPGTISQYYKALRCFHELTRRPDNLIQLRLTPGDLIGFDNRRILHGRTAFDPNTGNRWLRGCYLDHEELESRLRILARAAFAQASCE